MLMPRRAKRNRLTIFLTIGFILIIIILNWPSGSHTDQQTYSNEHIKEHVEKSVSSPENYHICEIPRVIRILEPVLDPIWTYHCENSNDSQPDWVACVRSKCSLNENVVAIKGQIECDFTDILWESDFNVIYGRSYKTSTFYILESSDFALVQCLAANGEKWSGILAGVAAKPKKEPTISDPPLENFETPSDERDKYNILILVLTSLSRADFVEGLPRTYYYLINSLEAVVLKGYNIIGDSLSKNFIPILTGLADYEISTEYSGKGDFIDFDMTIFSKFQSNGYETTFNEDSLNGGVFKSRYKGFREQRFDHYLRTFFLAIKKLGKQLDHICVDNKPRYKILLQYIANILSRQSNIPQFLVNIHDQLHSKTESFVEGMDIDLQAWLEDLQNHARLENTVLIIMSDKGKPANDYGNIVERKIEERMPFISFVFPKRWRQTDNYKYENFLQNIYRLSTPFDLYKTLLSFLSHEPENIESLSLFENIPKTRSCASARIEPQWCACFAWERVHRREARKAAKAIIRAVNQATKKATDYCKRLNLYTVIEALTLRPHNDFLRFKKNVDKDGYIPEFGTPSEFVSKIIHVKIIVSPGYGMLQGNVTYEYAADAMEISLQHIVRLTRFANRNGDHCLQFIDADAVDFCYCR